MGKIQKTIIGSLEQYCGCPFVPSNTKKEMPPYPYVSFSLIHAVTLKGTYCKGEKLYKPANLTYSFAVQSDNEAQCMEIAMTAKDYLDELGKELFDEKGIVIQDITGITSRDTLLTIEYEYRKGFDAVIAVFNEIGKSERATIGEANIKYENKGDTENGD